jgi:hypothetical protein
MQLPHPLNLITVAAAVLVSGEHLAILSFNFLARQADMCPRPYRGFVADRIKVSVRQRSTFKE